MLLRPIENRDKSSLLLWTNDTELWPYILKHKEVTEEEHELFFSDLLLDKNRAYFIIENDGEKAGLCGFRDIDIKNKKAEFFIFLQKAFRNKGLAMQSISHVLDYGWRVCQLHKIYLRVGMTNTHAYNVYKKVGFSTDGILRDDFYLSEQYYDVLMMSILEKESNE